MLENRFNKIKQKRPYLSSLVVFYLTLYDRNYSKREITRGFKLVDKDDYDKKDKKTILEDFKTGAFRN